MSSIFNQINYPYTTKFTQVKDYQIAYIDEGDSENILLFIHGLGSYLKAWNRNIPELKKYFRCIAIDLPGYGKSDKKVHSGEVNFYTEILNLFIQKLNLKKVTLCGHSMGGQISLSFAINFPDKIEKLILAAPAGFESFTKEDIILFKKLISPEIIYKTTDDQIRFNYKINFYKIPIEAEEMILDRIAIKDDPEFFNHCTVVSNSLFGLLNSPVFDQLNEIKAPTLILFGLEDLLIPNKSIHDSTTKEIATIGATKIRDSKLYLLDSCGHFIQFEKPVEFNNAIISFMNEG
jgi:pimeloyl-ACP methyl ester carboxylesterase